MAAAKETSVDAVMGTVLSKLETFFYIIKLAFKQAFLGEQHYFILVPTGFGKVSLKHCSAEPQGSDMRLLQQQEV